MHVSWLFAFVDVADTYWASVCIVEEVHMEFALALAARFAGGTLVRAIARGTLSVVAREGAFVVVVFMTGFFAAFAGRLGVAGCAWEFGPALR